MPIKPDYKTLCDKVYETEGVMMNREFTEGNAVNAVRNSNSDLDFTKENCQNKSSVFSNHLEGKTTMAPNPQIPSYFELLDSVIEPRG